ncbi:Receptor expression-enhancing protein 5 [Trichinella pseudospiralis]|uniref:Receptor expression-enhancing protein n=1 Tax=Trichinella pseudospiralis TaxID=6337 RepID=A0A0V1G3P7_TRIPS|nr:Receptor expression-enhancing protein 5 [Trichinella pseudospiralis]KRZ41411.1 Receptor expression-enhancing protein 5 [Trichinella pseudospiralis]
MKETLQKDEQEMRKSKFNNVLLNMVEVGIYILYFLKFATTIQEICFDIFDIISNKKTFVGKFFNKIEEKTGRNRCEAATLLASVITLLLLFSKNAELLCNSICFAYPAVKSLEKVKSTENNTSYQCLLLYWIIFGLFSIVDFFAYYISYINAVYWLLKCVFFVWLFMPSCSGAEVLHGKLFPPIS